MQKPTRRLWTDDEITAMHKTISLLRRMRSAATIHPGLMLRVLKALDNFCGGKEKIGSPSEALSHAEALADAAGDFFAKKISKKSSGKQEFEKLQTLLSDEKRQYLLYNPTTYAKTGLREVVGNSIIARLRNIHIDPVYFLQWDLFQNNNLGVNSIEDLLSQDIGIIAPLSGDYMMAKIYKFYLQHTQGKTFPVHAIALNNDLSTFVLPSYSDYNPIFYNKSAIGIYIDTTETGNTGQAVYAYLRKQFPEKIVHEPKAERTVFTRSTKIESYCAESKATQQ